MGRLHQLERTFLANIAERGSHHVEFVVLDYASPDGCEQWILTNLNHLIIDGIVNYYRYTGADHFHASHAKNLAHRVAKGRIVCNVDADNFIGEGFTSYLLNEFAENERIFVRGPLHAKDACGRLAFRKSDFLALGGYDERFGDGWGYEDWDLPNRARAWGLNEVFISDPSYLRAIPHGDDSRLKFMRSQNRWETDRLHSELSANSIRSGQFVANQGALWGQGKLVENFQTAVVL